MDVYLPIAEVSVNAPLLLVLGAVVGFVSGLFGIGGGFLMAPVLIFMGIPPTIAVASQANHVVASSASSVAAYSRQGGVDYKLGGIMAAGGVLGALIGVELFRWLRLLGQGDLVVAVSYLVLLGFIGSLMLKESLTVVMRRRQGRPAPAQPKYRPAWIYDLPGRMKFEKSGLVISVIPIIVLGVLTGILSAIMGIGGGFILVPTMVYILRIKAQVVVGTSLFQILIATGATTILQAGRNQTVDIMLAGLLMFGGVLGAQFGAKASGRFRADELRAVLGFIILMVGLHMGLTLFLTPEDLFALAPGVN